MSQEYHRTKVCFKNIEEQQNLHNLGICLDHYKKEKGCIVTDFSDFELQQLSKIGIDYEIEIYDVVSHYKTQNNTTQQLLSTSSLNCNSIGSIDVNSKYNTPTGFALGSIGGFFTYQEFLAHLDTMHARFPHLITAKTPIDTFLTHENRPIYQVKISDQPTNSEAEPQVLYTALHHAREPAGLSQLIFFMYYLLENYDQNPKIKALIDNTELYFVPMINPDGYIFNQTNEPSGGGLWRKNRRDNLDGTYGVDLNRNYSYQWGGSGASSNTNSDVYHGPTPFSEPETQAIKHIVENHNFKFALNYHTFSDLLLFPFGYEQNVFSDDHTYFQDFTTPMVRENNYANIMASELYPAAGDSDDWFYADSLKPKVFALTPEVGSANEGFWPPSSNIIQLCKENVQANIILTELVHDYHDLIKHKAELITQDTLLLSLFSQRLGLDSNLVHLTISAVSPNIQSISTDSILLDLAVQEIKEDSFLVAFNSLGGFQDTLEFLVEYHYPFYSNAQTIQIITQPAPELIEYQNSIVSNSDWNGNWDISNETFVSADFSLTDSPFSEYQNQSTSICSLSQNFDLSTASFAQVHFWAKWDIENDYDYVVFEVFDQNTWTPLCGNYTNAGTNDQIVDAPLYDGTQDWIYESVDLSAYYGIENIQFRFRLESDNFVTADGFYVDDFTVFIQSDSLTTSLNQLTAGKSAFKVFPNPSNGQINLLSTNKDLVKAQITLMNTQRQVVFDQSVQFNQNQAFQLNKTLSPGVYFLSIQQANMTEIKKLVVQ